MKIIILDKANTDLIHGHWLYEKQELGLGHYFLSSLYSDIDSLRRFGGIHAKMQNDLYRSQSRRFPYSIYYKKEGEMILIHAVLDNRKKPEKIKENLK